MSKEGILIVSAGVLQIAGVEKAKELGFTVYITDLNEKASAVPYADYFIKLSTKDVDGHIAIAKKLKEENKIIAVYTQGCDVEYTVAMAAKAAGLPGIDPEVALNCNDKSRTREILNRKKVDVVKYAAVRTEEEALQAVRTIGLPCIIKPLDNSASRGLMVINREEEVCSGLTNALANCFLRKEAIIEEFLRGEEHSVDTVLYRGKMFPAGISDRQFRPIEKYSVQVGSMTPSLLPAETQKAMYALMNKAAAALGVENGAFKGDLIIVNGKPKIIEVTARTSGGFDSQYRKPYSFGIDILKATIDLAMGKELDPLDLVPKWVKWSKTTSVFPRPGRIVSIKGLQELRKLEGFKNIFHSMKLGDLVKDYTNCASRINHIIIVADTYEKLNELEDEVHETLIIKTEEV